MSLEVIEVNSLATIQDSGRMGWRQFGVPTSGPMDPFAFRAANKLAGNDSNCAAIEIGPSDITFRAMHDCVVAVTGVGFNVAVYVWEFLLWSSFFVRGGWTIHLNKMDEGMWAYLAMAGGVQPFDTAQGKPVLGSRSTYLRGAFGGFDGRQLQVGDRILSGKPLRSLNDLAARTLSESARPAYSDHPIIDVIMGPQTKYFNDESIETFLSSEYSISITSDRMGYRLDGPALTHRNKAELISEGMTMGAIQVPSNGQPIVMMADCPTTGGYPKIATVPSADLPLLAQCVPNKSRIRFRETTVAKAQKKYRALMNGLNDVIEVEDKSSWY